MERSKHGLDRGYLVQSGQGVMFLTSLVRVAVLWSLVLVGDGPRVMSSTLKKVDCGLSGEACNMAPFERWQDAVTALCDQLRLATDPQRDLAHFLGISIGKKVPALVAAELLKVALVEPLNLPNPILTSDYQYDYLLDLASECDLKPPPRPSFYQVSDAWIRWFLGKKNLIHLRRVRPAPGDIVRVTRKQHVRTSLVSSISRNGRVNLRGLDGGAYPHQIEIVARANATDAANAKLRESINRRLREEARIRPDFADHHLRYLEPYLVETPRSDNSVEELIHEIKTSVDERGPQKVIEENPALLAALVSTSLGVWVIPQKRLGAEFVTDFMLAYRDSTGMHWIAVELESPTAAQVLQNGNPAKELRTAEQQIHSWRNWLESNLDYARRPPSENGLGLVHVHSKVPGLIIIGRMSRQPPKGYSIVANRLKSENHIDIHSYDWLVREAKTLRGIGRGGSLSLDEIDDEFY